MVVGLSAVIRRFLDTLDTQLFPPIALKYLPETEMPVNDNAGSSAYVNILCRERRGTAPALDGDLTRPCLRECDVTVTG